MNAPPADLPPLHDVHFLIARNQRWLETGQGHVRTPRYQQGLQSFYVAAGLLVPLILVGVLLGVLSWLNEPAQFRLDAVSFIPLAFVLGMFLFVFPSAEYFRLRALERGGQIVMGEIVEYAPDPSASWAVDWRHRGEIAELRYRFVAPSGEAVIRSRRYNPLLIVKKLEPGMKIAILYADPVRHEIL